MEKSWVGVNFKYTPAHTLGSFNKWTKDIKFDLKFCVNLAHHAKQVQ